MAAHRWKVTNPSTLDVLEFPINPSEMRLPTLQKSITAEATTAPGPNGRVILFEGADQAQTIGFSGVVLDLTQLEFFEDLFALRRQFLLEDDLGRQFWVYPTKLERTRTRSGAATHPGRHSYTFEGYILDWPS